MMMYMLIVWQSLQSRFLVGFVDPFNMVIPKIYNFFFLLHQTDNCLPSAIFKLHNFLIILKDHFIVMGQNWNYGLSELISCEIQSEKVEKPGDGLISRMGHTDCINNPMNFVALAEHICQLHYNF